MIMINSFFIIIYSFIYTFLFMINKLTLLHIITFFIISSISLILFLHSNKIYKEILLNKYKYSLKIFQYFNFLIYIFFINFILLTSYIKNKDINNLTIELIIYIFIFILISLEYINIFNNIFQFNIYIKNFLLKLKQKKIEKINIKQLKKNIFELDNFSKKEKNFLNIFLDIN